MKSAGDVFYKELVKALIGIIQAQTEDRSVRTETESNMCAEFEDIYDKFMLSLLTDFITPYDRIHMLELADALKQLFYAEIELFSGVKPTLGRAENDLFSLNSELCGNLERLMPFFFGTRKKTVTTREEYTYILNKRRQISSAFYVCENRKRERLRNRGAAGALLEKCLIKLDLLCAVSQKLMLSA